MKGLLTSSSLLALLRAFFFARRDAASAVYPLAECERWGDSSMGARCLVNGFFDAAEDCESLLWIREWRVSSSEREKRFSQPGKAQTKGFSPVCVRMWRVWEKVEWVVPKAKDRTDLVFKARKGSATENVGTLVRSCDLPLGGVVVEHVGCWQRCGEGYKASGASIYPRSCPGKCRLISLLSPC